MLRELIERMETAHIGEESDLLSEAWDALAEHMAVFRRAASLNAAKFGKAIDAEAFESAAIMLAPPTTWFSLRLLNTDFPEELWRADLSVEDGCEATCRTPALAIAAAALKAWADA